MSLLKSLTDFDPDTNTSPVVALSVEMTANEQELPFHQHRKAQLVLTLHGGVTCEVEKAYWMVPVNYAVWIPGGMPHSNRATVNAQIFFLFVEPDYPGMPQECCTLYISPMLREMIKHFADTPPEYAQESHSGRLAQVMLHELSLMPVEHLCLPITTDARIKMLAAKLINNPGNRSTLHDWASQMAMSDRSFERFICRETGMTFGKWRQQLYLLIAVRMLVTGSSVQNIAYELGYESPTAFITMFKKALGKTPGRYLEES